MPVPLLSAFAKHGAAHNPYVITVSLANCNFMFSWCAHLGIQSFLWSVLPKRHVLPWWRSMLDRIILKIEYTIF